MPFVQLAHARLHYYEHGSGPEVVVFVHGFEGSGRVWQLTQERLPGDRYYSIAIDNRGAGPSDAPPNDSDYGVQIFAADVHELVTRLGLREVTLVGHSFGGITATQVAVDHPDLVKGLVLLSPSDPDGHDTSPEETERAIEARIAARRAQQAHSDSSYDLGARSEETPATFLRLLTADMRAAPEQRLRGTMRSTRALRLGAAAGRLPMPVLLACGDADREIALERLLATWARYPPGTGLHVWHGVGHSPNVEAPRQLTDLLRRFIEQTIPARPATALMPHV
jgi:pimeloyl-ACP methyl ester carboxylesterase